MPPTLSQAEVHYRPAEVPGVRCGTCVMFRPPHACTLVQGVIYEDGVCDRWSPRDTDGKGARVLGLNDLLAELRTAETPVVSTVHEPFGSPTGPGLFHVKGLELPAYVQHVAHALVASGLPESEAIQRAVGVIRDWAAGRTPNGKGHVHPDVQAAAAKALAQWEAAKAVAHGKGRADSRPVERRYYDGCWG
jgi:hypothetical protein